MSRTEQNRTEQNICQLFHTLCINSLTTRGPGPYIDHVLYEGPRAGALSFGENSVNCRHGNTFCFVH